MTSLQSAAVLRPDPRPIPADDLAPECFWRGVCEYPGGTPAQMAMQVGRAALAAAEVRAEQVQWILHTGSGAQGSQGWPMHHHIQHGIVGCHGNAVEVKQNCAGGLTSWLLGSRLLDEDGVSICTGADNWEWTDRFVMTREVRWRTLRRRRVRRHHRTRWGFAKLLGSATASDPAAADDWQIREGFWQTTDTAEGFGRAYADATSAFGGVETGSFRMFVTAVSRALIAARVSPQYVTHFVPQASGSGQPFRALAKVMGLPWQDALHEHKLDHGYLGVSTQVDGLVHLAETGELKKDSIVLLLASEYQFSTTAIVLRVVRPPRVSEDAMVRVIA